MLRSDISCCSDRPRRTKTNPGTIPAIIQEELDRLGGFETLSKNIPGPGELDEKSQLHHALSDPLRLTILHLVRDQPLCVCVINRFMRIADSKLSYHLTILKDAGLIEGEYHGNWIIYRITETGSRYLAI